MPKRKIKFSFPHLPHLPHLPSLGRKVGRFFLASTYTGRRKADKEIDKTIEELESESLKIKELDRKIIQLQQSGRTSFRAMNKIHVYLSMRSKLYHSLHTLQYSNRIHLGALAVFLISTTVTALLLYSPMPRSLRLATSPKYIGASSPEDPSIYTGDNGNLSVGFSNKETKTVGATIVSKSDRIPNASQYQLSINLLSDGLDIPANQQVSWSARQQVSQGSHTTPNPSYLRRGSQSDGFLSYSSPKVGEARWGMKNTDLGIQTAHAEDSSTSLPTADSQLPANTVTSAKVNQIENQVFYHITDQITAKYVMEPNKVKEFITIKEKDALKGNTLSFALNSQGLVFKEDGQKDGSWIAVPEEYKDKTANESPWVFRLAKPTIEDKDKKSGIITMTIEGDKAIYTIDQNFLANASYPITIDPTITPSGTTCTWDNGSGVDSNWATVNNWSCPDSDHADGPPAAGDAVVFDSTSYDPTTGASDSVKDDLYSVTMNGLNWDGGGNNITTSVTDTTNHIAYFGTYETPARIIKFDVANNKILGLLTLQTDENNLISSAIDIANGYAFFGTGTSPAKLIKVRLSDFTEQEVFTAASGENNFYGGILTSDGAYAYFGTYTSAAKIIKITTSNMTQSGSTFTLVSGENQVRSAITDGSYAYFSLNTNPGKFIKIDLSISDVTQSKVGDTLTLDTGAFPGCGVSDGTFGYFCTDTRPGSIIKINLANMAKDSARTLNSGDDLVSGSIDTAAGVSYFGDGYTGGVVKVQNSDLSQISTKLSVGGRGNAMALDASAGYIYAGLGNFGCYNGGCGASSSTIPAPGTITRITLSNFTNSATHNTGTSLYLRKHAIISNDDTPNNYKWDMETLTVNSGQIDFEGDSAAGGTCAGSGAAVCGLGMEINANDIIIAGSARLSAEGKGFPANQGPGTGSGNYRGASYGGIGGYSDAGPTYGSITAPISLGSGSSSSLSGGAIKLSVSGTLTINGTINASAKQYGDGASAGGSIFLSSIGMLVGNGTIMANGGDTNSIRGSGGGGRIAIVATSSSFSGTVSAHSGNASSAAYYGGAGTIYQNIGGTKTVTVDNNSLAGGNGTSLPDTSAGCRTTPARGRGR